MRIKDSDGSDVSCGPVREEVDDFDLREWLNPIETVELEGELCL